MPGFRTVRLNPSVLGRTWRAQCIESRIGGGVESLLRSAFPFDARQEVVV